MVQMMQARMGRAREDEGREADISTQAATPQAGSRFSAPHAHIGRQEGAAETPPERPHSVDRRPQPVTRLRRSADFRRALDRGERYADQLLAVRALMREPGGRAEVRLGVSVGRRYGKAVERNRVRRRLREAVRAAVNEARRSWDLVLIPRAAARMVPYDELRESVSRLLRRAGVVGAVD
jgi:ribonuclease P protein component